MTSTLTRLAESAVAARGGADLYRFGLHDRIPDAAFASQADGSVVVTGIDFLKSGSFNGLGLVDADLEAMVQHFTALRDAGIFVPPFRLDHSWSILSVIGYVEELETYRRVDATDSMEKTFLRGNVRLTGSLDYTPAQLVKAIKGGHLRNRSSELGYYVTNSGVEIPLAFYGCAFVDIPAVEGLAAVTLSQNSHRPEPARIVNLTSTTPEGSAMTDDNPTPGTDTPGDGTAPETAGTPDAPEAGTDPGTGDGGELTDEEAADAARDQQAADDAAASSGNASAGDTTPGQDDASVAEGGTPAGGTVDAPTGAPADEVETLRREIATLRAAEATRAIETFTRSGAIVDANRTDAEALLRHDDPEVRRAAGTILGHAGTQVALGRQAGRTQLGRDGNVVPEGGKVIELGMTPEEVGALWADLTPAERKLRQGEYDAWRLDRNA